MEALSISEARKRLFELRQQVVADNDRVIMTHRQGNVVLISMDEWEAYQETVRLLNDKEALSALVDSFVAHDTRGVAHDLRETRGKTPDEIFTDLS
jgi:antitoxin YefM